MLSIAMKLLHSFFFLTPEKRVEKDNFLIETTYATYSRMILEKKSTSAQKNY